MPRIYLDYQIIDHLYKNELPEIDEKINELKKQNYIFPYSPAHCEEIAVPVIQDDKTDQIKRLKTISSVSYNNSLLPYPNKISAINSGSGVYFCIEPPEQCYDRVAIHYHRNPSAERISKKQLEDAKISPNRIDPIKQNNSTAEKILSPAILEEIIFNFIKESKGPVLTNLFKQLRIPPIERSFFPKTIEFGNLFQYTRSHFAVFETIMELTFNKIEELGYFPEPVDKYRSRLHDVSHVIYGSYCKYFVTRDVRLRKKCTVAFKALGIPCSAISTDEFLALTV